MKSIKVAAAAIIRDGKVLAAQRGYGNYRGWWEFPGGKAEPGETLPQALKREIREELGIDIEAGKLAGAVEHDYPEFHVALYCFFCRIQAGRLELKEHESARWLDAQHLDEVKWLASDLELLPVIKAELEKSGGAKGAR